MERTKTLLVGILVGMILGSGLAWAAAQRTVLISPNERPLGTVDNPLYIQN